MSKLGDFLIRVFDRPAKGHRPLGPKRDFQRMFIKHNKCTMYEPVNRIEYGYVPFTLDEFRMECELFGYYEAIDGEIKKCSVGFPPYGSRCIPNFSHRPEDDKGCFKLITHG